jgi:hypothetical protein
MDRGTNETPGSESKGGRQKLHLGPPYKTYMEWTPSRRVGVASKGQLETGELKCERLVVPRVGRRGLIFLSN